ncbi:hypothetical protein MTO96_017142 [Rhipicephalus appendiculatus]
MAYHLIVLKDLTVAQLKIIAEQRNRRGFHAHYTGGFDASRKNFNLYCPGYMTNGCSLTTVFHDSYPILLGQYNIYRDTYVRLLFAGADELQVQRRYKGNSSHFSTQRSKNLEGIHVLEFKRELLNMKVFLDGDLLLPARSITDGADLDAHVVLCSVENLNYSPFVFYESHYTDERRGFGA